MDLLIAGLLQTAGLVAGVAFLIGVFGGATVKVREHRERISDSWRSSHWKRRS